MKKIGVENSDLYISISESGYKLLIDMFKKVRCPGEDGSREVVGVCEGKVVSRLKKGLYRVYNGKSVDNVPYAALLLIVENEGPGTQYFVSSYTASPMYGEVLNEIVLANNEDIFEKFQIKSYQTIY